jgi:hypothetical protein
MQKQASINLKATVAGLFQTTDRDQFETASVDALSLDFDGIRGDRHGGYTRRSGGREPWYRRGTEIRNERQVSLLCPHDLAAIAERLDLPRIKPEWIGANLLIDGLASFTLLPPRTCLFFASGVTIRIDGLNVPCRASGRALARHYPEREGLDLAFVKAAKDLRGLVGWIEKPGVTTVGDAIDVRIPEQWIYQASR